MAQLQIAACVLDGFIVSHRINLLLFGIQKLYHPFLQNARFRKDLTALSGCAKIIKIPL
jgi:hypothetical protein